MPKEKKNKSSIPRMIPGEELLAKYIRKVVREEVEKYFDERIPELDK